MEIRLHKSYYAEGIRVQSRMSRHGERAGKTYRIGFAGKYPEGGAEEGKEAKPKLSPPQGLNCQGLAASMEPHDQKGNNRGEGTHREIPGRPGQLPPVRVLCRTPAAVPWMLLSARHPREGAWEDITHRTDVIRSQMNELAILASR